MVWDTDLMTGDLEVSLGDLTHDGGLETAVYLSLFTDRRARDDDVLLDPDNPDKRGWWGDLISPEVEGDQMGSRLWLLRRAKTIEESLIKAKEYAEESLQWLIEDKVASNVIVSTERIGTPGKDWLAILVQVIKGSTEITELRYDVQWGEQLT